MAADCIRNIKKKTVRVKESVFQSLGKADRTLDKDFADINSVFSNQQKNGYGVRNHLRSYLLGMRTANQALHSLHDSMIVMYEPEIGSNEQLKRLIQDHEVSWDAYLSRSDKLFNEAVQYCSQFTPYRDKISKRNRKLIDYDSARHDYDSIANSTRKTDESLKKASDRLYAAKTLYDDLNVEILNELPPVIDTRLPFILKFCRQFFDDSSAFHCQSLKTTKELNEIVSQEDAKFKERPLKQHTIYSTSRQAKMRETTNDLSHSQVMSAAASDFDPSDGGTLSRNYDATIVSNGNQFSSCDLKPYPSGLKEESGTYFSDYSTTNLLSDQSGKFYKLQVIHKYIPSEPGELALEIGHTVQVLPFEGNLEKGWAYGSIVENDVTGLFPLIFTRIIQD